MILNPFDAHMAHIFLFILNATERSLLNVSGKLLVDNDTNNVSCAKLVDLVRSSFGWTSESDRVIRLRYHQSIPASSPTQATNGMPIRNTYDLQMAIMNHRSRTSFADDLSEEETIVIVCSKGQREAEWRLWVILTMAIACTAIVVSTVLNIQSPNWPSARNIFDDWEALFVVPPVFDGQHSGWMQHEHIWASESLSSSSSPNLRIQDETSAFEATLRGKQTRKSRLDPPKVLFYEKMKSDWTLPSLWLHRQQFRAKARAAAQQHPSFTPSTEKLHISLRDDHGVYYEAVLTRSGHNNRQTGRIHRLFKSIERRRTAVYAGIASILRYSAPIVGGIVSIGARLVGRCICFGITAIIGISEFLSGHNNRQTGRIDRLFKSIERRRTTVYAGVASILPYSAPILLYSAPIVGGIARLVGRCIYFGITAIRGISDFLSGRFQALYLR